MNSLEASRVIWVVDETLEAVRLISYITQDVLDTAEQLRDMLGQELAQALTKHRQLAQQHGQSKGSISNEQLTHSTLELVRLLKKSPSAHRLQHLPYDRSLGMLQLLQYLEKLRGFAQKRLTTTVEEDSSNKEYFEEVREREEKAVADRLQLEQKLRLQRVELQKAATTAQSAEDRVRAELHEVQSASEAAMRNIDSAAVRQAEGDTTHFGAEHQALAAELAAAKAQLQKLRDDHKNAEGLLRKARKRGEQDVEGAIGEYDGQVGAKEDELSEARTAYDELSKQLEETHAQWSEMYHERMEYEERLRQEEARKLAENINRIRTNHAARVIQRAWKAYKERLAKARKKAKKLAAKEAAKKKKK